MRIEQKQGGFTIIEVILFLAITALLLSIALIGTRNSIQSSRYTDSVRSTESTIKKQFDEILNGVNPRASNLVCDNDGNVSVVASGGASPGNTDCVYMGKLLRFTEGQSKFDVYTVVGTEPNNFNPSTMVDSQMINAFRPHVVTAGGTVSSAEIPWGATIAGVKRSDNPGISSLAFLRSPLSSTIISYAFNWSPGNGNDISALTASSSNFLQSKTVNVCIKSADDNNKVAAVVVGGGQGQSSVTTNFDVAEGADC